MHKFLIDSQIEKNIARWQAFSQEQQAAILPEVFSELSKVDGPIADEYFHWLLQFPNELTPLVSEILEVERTNWQLAVLQKVVPHLPFYSKLILFDQLQLLSLSTDTVISESANAALQVIEP